MQEIREIEPLALALVFPWRPKGVTVRLHVVRDATPNIQFTSCLGRDILQRTLPPIPERILLVAHYVMLHLIFSLPHAWGGTTCSVRCLRFQREFFWWLIIQPTDYPF